MRLLPRVFRRLLGSCTLLLAASALCFLLAELAPGDPLSHLRLDPSVSAETLELLRVQYRLDQPVGERYRAWLDSMARGDWGYSLTYHRPVWQLLEDRAPITLALVLLSSLAAWLLALPGALRAANRQGGWLDRALNTVAAGLQAIPVPVLALALLAVAASLELQPLGGACSAAQREPSTANLARAAIQRLILPATALALASAPLLFRQARAALAQALASPVVLAARARGLPEARVLGVHALSLAAKPLIGLMSLSFAGLLSGSLAVEVIFGLPGLGPLVLDAVSTRDLYLVTGGVLVAGIWLQAVQLATDLLLDFMDPRVRPPTE